ncbi:hypothetical protein [Paraglaciecola aestuariivivens]
MTLLLCCTSAQASSSYLGYSQAEQVSFAGNRELHFAPKGPVGLISFDLTDKLQVSVNFAELDDQMQLSERIAGQLNIESWGIFASYYWQNWSISANYSKWQDDLGIAVQQVEQSVFQQQSRSPSVSFSIGHDWTFNQWQLGLVAGLHQSKWELAQRLFYQQSQIDQSSLDQGHSRFVSLAVSTSKFVALSAQHDLMLGLSLGWNQVINSESAAISRNGRNISQITNRVIANQLAAAAAIGTESYGQMHLFVSFDLGLNWILDIDTSLDFASTQNSQAWSINLGYLF